jgi:butyrate kinase
MYDLHRSLDVQLRAMHKPLPTLILPEADDLRTVEAAERLTKFANIVLLTDENTLGERLRVSMVGRRFRGTVDRLLRKVQCVNIKEETALQEEFAQAYVKLGEGKRWAPSIAQAREAVKDPVCFAVLATRLGYADMVVGGLTHASRDFFVPCLRLLERQDVVYEMGLFALPEAHPPGMYEKNLVMFADVALNPVPSPEALARIAVGACKTMRDTVPVEDLPHVNGALLSYSTRGSGEGPSVERVREAAKLIEPLLEELRKESPKYETIRIDAELQVSVALSLTAARNKLGAALEAHPAAGRANVLIAPNLDVGNLLYHIYATRYPNSQQLLLIGGIHNRALDFSRSSSADEVVLGVKGLILRHHLSTNSRMKRKDYFFPCYRVLAINPGSTSTKLALYRGEQPVFEVSQRHDQDELQSLGSVAGQLDYRAEVVRRVLQEHRIAPGDLDAVVGRGGMVRSIQSGTYEVNQDMLDDLGAGTYGEHPSNLGAFIAQAVAQEYGTKAYVVDPPVVDELDEVARITGLPGIARRPAWHALNQKAVAKRFADERGWEYEQVNLIVAHLGGGISVGAHRRGRCVFVRDALFDGPLTPNRSGSLPQRELVKLCYSGLDEEEVVGMLLQQSGLAAHVGTTDLRRVEALVDRGDERAALVLEAMVQQVAMEISALFPKFLGERVERIVITGGMAHSTRLTARLKELLQQVPAEVTVIAGEDELLALRDGAQRVLAGDEVPAQYRSER